jgi:hypothetical protein
MFGRGYTVHVPACSRCSWRIRSQRVGGFLLTLAVAAAFMFFVWPYLNDFVARSIRKWVALALIIVCLLPWFLWDTIFPPSIDITAYRDNVDYEFRDADYAYEFAALNEDADWVKVE